MRSGTNDDNGVAVAHSGELEGATMDVRTKEMNKGDQASILLQHGNAVCGVTRRGTFESLPGRLRRHGDGYRELRSDRPPGSCCTSQQRDEARSPF